MPEKIAAAAESIRGTDRVIELTGAVERHREELGLPVLDKAGKRIKEVVD